MEEVHQGIARWPALHGILCGGPVDADPCLAGALIGLLHPLIAEGVSLRGR